MGADVCTVPGRGHRAAVQASAHRHRPRAVPEGLGKGAGRAQGLASSIGPAGTRSPNSSAAPSSAAARTALERQHDAGKLTARERIDAAVRSRAPSRKSTSSSRTAAATSAWSEQIVPGDGVVAGHGRVDGRLVYAFAQDFTVFGGSLSETNAAKIVQDHGPGGEDGRAGRRPQRLRRRAHPGRRGLARRLRRHLPAQHARLRRRPADLRDHGPVRRRRRLLAGDHRLHDHGRGHELHVRDRARRDPDGDARGGDEGRARRRDDAQREERRRALRRRRRSRVPRADPRAAVVPAANNLDDPPRRDDRRSRRSRGRGARHARAGVAEPALRHARR